MKVIAQTAALREALDLAGSIVATSTPKPVLQCVKLVAADKTLMLMSTDLEVGCRYRVMTVQVKQPCEALVPAERLVGIIRESGDDDAGRSRVTSRDGTSPVAMRRALLMSRST